MDRFWSKVSKTDKCWMWTGASARFGYGNSYFNGKNVPAHRLSWILENGEIPKGMNVCHKCDNPRCVKPDHLFLGSQAENMRDMRQKNRGAKGERHGSAKLSLEDVLQIKLALKQGRTQTSIALEHHVGVPQISRIASGKRWPAVMGNP